MYEHVAVEHLLFQVLQHRKHYTAHHASTRPSESDNASKETELKSEYIVEHLYSTLRSQNERRNGNLHIPKNHTNYTQIAGVMLQGFAFSFDPSTMQ